MAKRKIRIGTIGSKVRQHKDTKTNNATALSLAKETKNSSTAGSDRAFSNRGNVLWQPLRHKVQ